jgi:hypothetical protein
MIENGVYCFPFRIMTQLKLMDYSVRHALPDVIDIPITGFIGEHLLTPIVVPVPLVTSSTASLHIGSKHRC